MTAPALPAPLRQPDGSVAAWVKDPRSALNGQVVRLAVVDGRLELEAMDISPTLDMPLLLPGLCDLFCRMPEPGYEHRGTRAQLAADALAGGFTDVLCLPNTLPVRDRPLAEGALLAGALPRLHWAGALSVGTQGKDMAELLELHESGVRAFTDGVLPVQDAGLLLRCLAYLQTVQGLILQVPLHKGLAGGGVATESPFTTGLGLKAQPAMAEDVLLARDLRLLEYAGGRMHFTPITTAASVALIRQAKAKGLAVSASTSPFHLSLTDEALASFDARFKLTPPLRTEADRQAVIEALADGTLDALASHHEPFSPEEKLVEFDYAEAGAPALREAFAAAWQALARAGSASPAELLAERMAHAPRRLLGLPERSVGQQSPLDECLLVLPLPSRVATRLSPFQGEMLPVTLYPLAAGLPA